MSILSEENSVFSTRTKEYMKITAVKITIVPNESHLKAYASITINDCFVVHDLKVIRTDDKLFVAMPSKRHKSKNIFRDIAHPLDKETRQAIQNAVFKEYEKILQQFKSEEENMSSLNLNQD